MGRLWRIPESELNRIFEVYNQKKSLKIVLDKTGVGLYTVQYRERLKRSRGGNPRPKTWVPAQYSIVFYIISKDIKNVNTAGAQNLEAPFFVAEKGGRICQNSKTRVVTSLFEPPPGGRLKRTGLSRLARINTGRTFYTVIFERTLKAVFFCRVIPW